MNNNSVQITPRAAVSLGLALMLAGSLVAAAVTWGRMEAQIAAKLDCAVAERDFVRKADLADRLDAIERRLMRIEDKLDQIFNTQEKP
ncbi:MAG: hypothetical protein N2512_00605 [Armatimonadetes bacterium]|nr:hypothetical protein [Armatimonadota bacterium]